MYSLSYGLSNLEQVLKVKTLVLCGIVFSYNVILSFQLLMAIFPQIFEGELLK